MTKKFKQGDKVYMAYDPTISAIVTDVCYEGKYDYYVRKNDSEFTTGCYECDLLDVKTAFLTELQALLRKYDAEIYDGDMYYITIDIDANSRNKQEINYPLYKMDKYCLDADNIMNFDKE